MATAIAMPQVPRARGQLRYIHPPGPGTSLGGERARPSHQSWRLTHCPGTEQRCPCSPHTQRTPSKPHPQGPGESQSPGRRALELSRTVFNWRGQSSPVLLRLGCCRNTSWFPGGELARPQEQKGMVGRGGAGAGVGPSRPAGEKQPAHHPFPAAAGSRSPLVPGEGPYHRPSTKVKTPALGPQPVPQPHPPEQPSLPSEGVTLTFSVPSPGLYTPSRGPEAHCPVAL